MKSFIEKVKNNYVILLGLIIILAVVKLICMYSLRDGHHVDETWSYGFANSYYDPYIYSGTSRNSLTVFKNVGTWVTGDAFKDYISVSDDQRFSFDSVIYNKLGDLSPALYELILHFVCSLFPGNFSWNYAFVINVLCYIPSLILLFLISVELTRSKLCGFFTVIYYVFSGCGTANFLFLRVYHLFTLLVLFLVYLLIRIAKYQDNRKWVALLLLPVPTILCALDHFYFLVIAFFLTATFAILLLFKKRFWDALRVCYIMLFSVMAFFAIWTPSLDMLMPYTAPGGNVTGYYSYPYSWDLAVANMHFFYSSIGFFINFTVPDIIEFLGTLAFIAVIIGLIVFLFRNEQWMKKTVSSCASSAKSFKTFISSVVTKIDSSAIALLVSVLCYLLVIPYSASLTDMGYVERYFFPTMTVFIAVFISCISFFVKFVVTRLKNKYYRRVVPSVIVLLFFALSLRSNFLTSDFLFMGMGENDLHNDLIGKNCYVYSFDVRDLIWLSPILMDSNDVYVDCSKQKTNEDMVFPVLDSGDIFIINSASLLSDEQKEQMNAGGDFEVNGGFLPEVLMTKDELKEEFERQTGCDCIYIDEFNTFIGTLTLYECKK